MEGEVMEGGWSGDNDDDGDDLPSPEAKTTSRLALPEKNRGWRRLHDENWESDLCSGISSSRVKIGSNVRHQGVDPTQAATRRSQGGGRATRAPGPLVAPLWPIF